MSERIAFAREHVQDAHDLLDEVDDPDVGIVVAQVVLSIIDAYLSSHSDAAE